MVEQGYRDDGRRVERGHDDKASSLRRSRYPRQALVGLGQTPTGSGEFLQQQAAPPILLTDSQGQELTKNELIIILLSGRGEVSEEEVRANFAAAQGFRSDATAGQCLSLAENRVSRIPSLPEVLRIPAVMGAVQGLPGEDLEFHPHSFVHLTQPRLD